MLFRGLARKDDLGTGLDMLQQGRVYQIVVNHHIGELDALQATHRNQPGVARSCAHQIDFASGLHSWHCRAASSPSCSGCSFEPVTVLRDAFRPSKTPAIIRTPFPSITAWAAYGT